MSGYSSESKDIKDLQISGNLLFALLDFEFCFLLLGDPNVDFDLFIPEGCDFPIIPVKGPITLEPPYNFSEPYQSDIAIAE